MQDTPGRSRIQRFSNRYNCYMTRPESLSNDELVAQIRRLRYEQMRRAGKTHRCARCGSLFVARADARYCSSACRVATFRATPLSAPTRESGPR